MRRRAAFPDSLAHGCRAQDVVVSVDGVPGAYARGVRGADRRHGMFDGVWLRGQGRAVHVGRPAFSYLRDRVHDALVNDAS